MQRYFPTNSRSIQPKQPTVINFADPNIKATIPHLIADLTCCQNCQFIDLLTIFAQKIDKLRIERNRLKEKYIEDVHDLQKTIKHLQKQNQELKASLENPTPIKDKHKKIQNPSMKLLKALQHDFDFGLEFSEINTGRISEQAQQSQKQQNISNQEDESNIADIESFTDNINKMALRYNISGVELENIVKQYLEAEEEFESNEKEKKKVRILQEKLENQREKSKLREQINVQLKFKH